MLGIAGWQGKLASKKEDVQVLGKQVDVQTTVLVSM
jgi:hypothetical protein